MFLWEEDFATFNFEKYDPIKSNGVLTRGDLDLLERELKKSEYFKVGETSALGYYIIPWVVFVCATIYLIYAHMNDNFSNEILVYGLILTLFLLAVLITCYSRTRYNDRLKNREESFNRIVKALNRTIFQPKDITCQVGMYGAYIMFDLEFKTSI